MADRKAYDLLVQAESGLASVTGSPAEAARVGISIVDIATGATAHAAILEALISRHINHQGADIRISMFDVIADWLTVPLLHHEGGKPPARLGLSHPSIAPYGVFKTKDGEQLLLSIQSDREWRNFTRIFLNDASCGNDPRFSTNVERVRNREETDALVAAAFAQMTTGEAEERLLAADTAYAKMNDMAALADHPHLRRIIVDTEHGPVAIPAPAPIVTGQDRCYGAVPKLGGPES